MLLGEGAINFVPDARDRLMKPGGTIIPAGGCQYATLVEIPDFASTVSPAACSGFNLTRLRVLQDTLYWKASVGADKTQFTRLSERVCILEVDLRQGTKDTIPLNRTFGLPAIRPGTVHAVLFDWDIWVDAERKDILSTAPGSRNFAGDVAWGWLLQIQEEVDERWQGSSLPKPLMVKQGDRLDMGVEYLARGISIHVRLRHSSATNSKSDLEGGVLPSLMAPSRMHGVNRGDLLEASEYYLPVAGDQGRQAFYQTLLDTAIVRNATMSSEQTVLDCSGNAGLPALFASKQHGLHTLAMTRRNEFARVLRQVAVDNGVEQLMEAYAADPRDLIEILLPLEKRADIVVVDPPGTPLHGLSPFALLPVIHERLLKEGGQVVPGGACFEVGLVESHDLAQMFSVPHGRWEGIDLTVWNEEARRQGVLERLVPYTKWFGSHSSMKFKWLSEPRCVYEVDLSSYGRQVLPAEIELAQSVVASSDGQVHAVVGRWVVWESLDNRDSRLDSESDYLGRALTWPHYVQAVAAVGTESGVLDPVQVRAGQRLRLSVVVRQGKGKRTGAAGPEFSMHLDGSVAPTARNQDEGSARQDL